MSAAENQFATIARIRLLSLSSRPSTIVRCTRLIRSQQQRSAWPAKVAGRSQGIDVVARECRLIVASVESRFVLVGGHVFLTDHVSLGCAVCNLSEANLRPA